MKNSQKVNTYFKPDQERTIRLAISELRKEGIIFIPTNSHTYELVNEETPIEVVERFVGSQIRHLATQYFNTVKPLKNYVADEKMKTMMDQLSFLDLV